VRRIGRREQVEGGKARIARQGRQWRKVKVTRTHGEEGKKREKTTGWGGKEEEGEKKESRREGQDEKNRRRIGYDDQGCTLRTRRNGENFKQQIHGNSKREKM
jgi:hypothetical protein